jgi:hypothetical protein
LLLRQKNEVLVPGKISGRARFSALREFLRRSSSQIRAQWNADQVSFAREFDRRTVSPDLQGLIGTLHRLRQRTLTNRLLSSWTTWLLWILIALTALALVSSRLAGTVIFVAVLAAAGVAAIVYWTWRNRPSNYETAQRLDLAAGLRDRVSTAIYLGNIQDPAPDGMIGEQRDDALTRLAKIDPRGLFPMQMPGNLRRAAVLLLFAAGLFAYRVHHQPPLISLLQSTAHSQLVQSIFSPIVHAMEKDLQRTMALVSTKPDASGEETQRNDAASNTEDLWKADDKGAAAEEQNDQSEADMNDQQQDQMQAPGDQQGNPSADARPQENNSQAQQDQKASDNSDGKSGQQSEQQGPEGRQSLSQSLMQAMKNMMSNSANQQSNSRPQQQPNGQGAPQSGNSQQPGAAQSDKRGDSRGNSDAKQKASQTASEGAGSQLGSKELQKNQEMHPVNAVPDRVALEASGFKEQTRMKVATETGTAQMANSGATAKQDAVTNGAEQETIPARYRFYVQRYFEHADNGKH